MNNKRSVASQSHAAATREVSALPRGTISRLSKGQFGLITGDSEEVYFHYSALEWGNFSQLEEGQAVEYELYDGMSPLHFGYQGGPQAVSVWPI